MLYQMNTFFYLKAEDIPEPQLCFGALMSDPENPNAPSTIFTMMTIQADRSFGFHVVEWLDESLTSVKFKSGNHGVIELRRLGKAEFKELKKYTPFCSRYSFNEMVEGIEGVKV
jgi:hypothetical protein